MDETLLYTVYYSTVGGMIHYATVGTPEAAAVKLLELLKEGGVDSQVVEIVAHEPAGDYRPTDIARVWAVNQ